MIRCHLGTAQSAMGDLEQAKISHQTACNLDPTNTQCRFYLADVLYQIGEYDQSIQEAEKVKLVAPREPSIYDLLAKIHLKNGKKLSAVTVGYFLNFDFSFEKK